MKSVSRKAARERRHLRIREKVSGTAERPRLSIMISNKHMYVQFIDDDRAATLATASTHGGDGKNNVSTAKALGKRAGELALSKGIKNVVVDRGGYKFHGRVKAIVDAIKEAGILTGTKEAK